MNERRKGHIGRWHLLAMLVLVLVLGMSAGSAFAGRLTDTAAGLPKAAPPGSSSGVSACATIRILSAGTGGSPRAGRLPRRARRRRRRSPCRAGCGRRSSLSAIEGVGHAMQPIARWTRPLAGRG